MRTWIRLLSVLAISWCTLSGSIAVHADEPTPQWLSNEIYCLARVIYGEARGLPAEAQYDVAYSVMNRKALNRKDFGGNTACDVAFHLTKKPDGSLVRQYSGVTGSLNDSWKPNDWDAWFVSLKRAWTVYTKREVPSTKMQKALYYLNPEFSSAGGRQWFAKNLVPIGWSSSHLFFAER